MDIFTSSNTMFGTPNQYQSHSNLLSKITTECELYNSSDTNITTVKNMLCDCQKGRLDLKNSPPNKWCDLAHCFVR
ncbi:protein of unknown function [Vibrio tapetis subsp. tapetis]|uniref:Uncharacterized protein n=1 Tax=Vibrio tapetis subsp. tapetis TaxID=1671868 RepID=A0A2N8ZK10_9VIBR|nr:protein of unknown function [Vibrio tapetis subsp. tapetis]